MPPTDADRLIIFDTTLRDGEQSPGASMNLAEKLERLAESTRRKLTVEAKIRALTAQGRLQGWIMTLLPVAVAAALFVIEPEAMRPLVASWQGWIVCGAIVVLEIAGLLFIRRIMDIDI